jgi:archaellum biogenesis protein FlaJ (TadC family)
MAKSHSAKNDVQTLAGTLAMLIVVLICLSLVIPDFRLAVITIVEIFLMLAPFLYAGYVAYKMITTTSDESTAYQNWKATTATETAPQEQMARPMPYVLPSEYVLFIKPEYKVDPNLNSNPIDLTGNNRTNEKRV